MYTIGIDIGASKVAAALVKHGQILRFQKMEFKARGGRSIKQTVLQALDSVRGSGRISGVGVGVPCIFGADGKPFSCPNIRDLNPVALSRIIAKQYRTPVFLENDVKAAALAELKYGVGKKSKNFVFVAFGTGIGGAIVVDGKIYKGAFGWAGEFGHTVVKTQISKSKFQKMEDWEAISTKKFLKSGRTFKDVNDFAESIALGFVNITYALAPEYIVVGGGLSLLWNKRFSEKIYAAVERMQVSKKLFLPKIIVSSLKNKGEVLGVALLADMRRGSK